jgi:hypothetical protein
MFRPSYLLLAVTAASAHFNLREPAPIGFDDKSEGQGPCGGFDAKSRDGVSDWPIGGSAIHVQTTHSGATWTYKAALLNDTETWIDLIPAVSQKGLGDFCLPSVPAPAGWAGQEGVIQVVQKAMDGALYQVRILYL